MSLTIEGTQLHIADAAVIAFYFGVVLVIGLWSSRQNRGSIDGYFLAGRNMTWIPLGASLFASNVGSLHFVGLAGSGAASGIAIAGYEITALWVIILLGWCFLPVYIASGIYTMPEYMKERFGGQRIQVFLSIWSLIMYIFTKISADLYAGAIFIEQSLNWDMYAAIILLLVIAGLFTITGGLTAVMWTDFIQTIIMVIGAVALAAVSFLAVGGWQAMIDKYPLAVANVSLNNHSECGLPREDFFHLLRDPVTGDIPWPGTLGILITSIWYWCADQVIVQRTLAAKSFSHAKGGCVLAAYLKLLPLFLLVMPGMIARILFPDAVACTEPSACEAACGSPSGCSNIAYPLLVINLMPPGARGMMLAVMLSALMSSLTSIFNSSSTIFTLDIWRRMREEATEKEMLIVGRVCILVLVVISILWIPIIQQSQGSQLFIYIQQVSSYLAPPLCAVFVLAVFWARINEPGAFWSLVAGLGVGLIRFILDFAFPATSCPNGTGIDRRPHVVKNFHFLYFSIFLFAFTGIMCIIISMMTHPIPEQYLYRLTFWTRFSKKERLPLIPPEDDATEMSVISPGGSTRASSIHEEGSLWSAGDGDGGKGYGTVGSAEGEVGLSRRGSPKNGSPSQGTTPRSATPIEGTPQVSEQTAAGDGEGGTVIDVDDSHDWWCRLGLWVCGVEPKMEETEQEKVVHDKYEHHVSLDENFAAKIVLHSNAVLVCVAALAMYIALG